MTSKSSFLVSMKENSKRRLWVWIVSALAFMLVFPALTALTINGIIRAGRQVAESYGNTIAGEIIHERLINNVIRMVGMNTGMLLLSSAIAVISAVQGFSYLYSRKKIDFYMGMPVKRKKRFLVIWLNGILLYVIPYLAGLAISLLIAAGNGAVDRSVFVNAAAAAVANSLLYLGVYHMAILALMMTGNIVITGFAFLTFCLYEFLVRMVSQGYKQMFFRYFSYYGSDRMPVLSPFTMYINLSSRFSYTNRLDAKYLIGMLVFAAALGMLSYICYLKRPAEAAGRAMTFGITKPFVKVLLVVPAALFMGGVIADVLDFNPELSMEGIGWMIFAMALAVLLGSGVIQVIYEFDIKGCLHKISHIVISAALVALIFIAFRYDLFGYDSYIPSQNQIKSIAFVPDYYEDPTYGGAHFDGSGNYVSSYEYARKNMYLHNIEEICDMAEQSMKAYNQVDWYANDDTYDQRGTWVYVNILYRLKNGREVWRSLWVDVEDAHTVETLDKIVGTEEFKKGFFMGASDSLTAMLDNKEGKYKISTSYGNRIYQQKMSDAQAKEFLAIYQKDLALANFSNVRENTPVGMLSFSITEELNGSVYLSGGVMSRATRSWDVGVYIYPFYKDSIAYLKENGYYMDAQVKLEDIAKIQVVNYNYDAAKALQEERLATAGASAIGMDDPAVLLEMGAAGKYDTEIDARVYADYTQEEQIRELAECIYPNDLVVDDWDCGKKLDRNYQVIVYFKTDSEMTKNYGTDAWYGFLEGQVPKFVMEDTAYKE